MNDQVIDRMRDKPESVTDPEVRAALDRLQDTVKANVVSDEEADAMDALKLRGKAMDELEDGDFPKRHIETLESMTGPGLAKAQNLVSRAKRDSLICLVSPRGNGKTQIATYLAYQRRMEHRMKAGKYIKALNLFEALKETWSSRLSEDSVMRPYRQCGLLVIDEIHERGESEWENRKLVNLIDHRYDRMLVTILLGNIVNDQVSERLSPSIVSRMKETGGIINCDWPSYR